MHAFQQKLTYMYSRLQMTLASYECPLAGAQIDPLVPHSSTLPLIMTLDTSQAESIKIMFADEPF